MENLIDIIKDTKKEIYHQLSLLNINPYDSQSTINQLITASFWNANNNTTDFCFIDLIKGIVPLELFELSNKITNNTALTIPLLSHIYHFIFTSILKIWKDCCDHFAKAEKLANITQQDK